MATKTNKPAKVEKKVPARKLPGLLKKSYTKEAFEKKLLKKLYIESDKTLLKSVFSGKENVKGKDLICIPKDSEFSKKEFKQLKALAKDIKNNGPRFKLLPFAACAVFIASIVITVSVFKNPVAKYLIESGCEGVFGAKCEVGSVNVELTGISITINDLQIGNKNSEDGMKNLFVAEIIKLDVNLTKALRGKFHSDVIECTGMDFNTDRTTSCLLPAKADALKEEAEESQFMKDVKSRSENAVADVKAQIETMLGGSSADEIWANIQSQMKSQAAAEKVKTLSSELVAKWQAKPEEIKSQVASSQESLKELQSLKVSNAAEATAALTKVKTAKDNLDKTKKSLASVKTDLEADKKALENAKKELQDAVNSDINLAKNYTDMASNAGSIMNGLLDTAGYDMLGEYYPYAKMAVDYAVEWKANAASSSSDGSAEKVSKSSDAKTKTQRLKGTDFWLGNEPKVFIGKIVASGESTTSHKFDGLVTNVCSNPDYSGKPMVADVKLEKDGIKHNGGLTIDARSKPEGKLVQVNYKGSGFNGSYNAGDKASNGVPSISGKTALSFNGDMNSMTDLSGKGNVTVTKDREKPVMTSEGFGNEKFDGYYKAALEGVKELKVDYGVKFEEGDVKLTLSGNYSDILKDAIKNAASGIGGDVKSQLEAKLKESTGGYSSDALAKAGEFTGISSDVTSSLSSIDDIEKQLKKLETDFTKKQSSAAAEKAGSALKGKLPF